MYRRKGNNREDIEVLLVHPGGPFHKNKDDGFWHIPKGGIEDYEKPIDAAMREFWEETQITPPSPVNLKSLGEIRQTHKIVQVWAGEGDFPDEHIPSPLMLEIEHPKGSGNIIKFPEVDKLEFFPLPVAESKIFAPQKTFIERLKNILP